MISDKKSDKNLDAALEYAKVEALSASTIQTLSAFKSKIAEGRKALYKKSQKSQRLLRAINIKDIIAWKSSNNR